MYVCMCIIWACWHLYTHMYLRVYCRWRSQGYAFKMVLMCFHKPWRSLRTAVLQPCLGSDSPGVWPPSPVLSHFESTLGIQLLWRNQSTTPESFRLLGERCGRILNNGWLIPPLHLHLWDSRITAVPSEDTNDTDPETLNINKVHACWISTVRNNGIHLFLHSHMMHPAVKWFLSCPDFYLPVFQGGFLLILV